MQHFVELVDALSWPLLVLFFLLFYRSEIRALLDRLTYLKVSGIEVNVHRQLDEADAKLTETVERLHPSVAKRKLEKEPYVDFDKLSLLTEWAPRSAIAEAWVCVESAITDTARKLPITESGRRTAEKLIKDMKRRGFVAEGAMDIYLKLQDIRRDIAHLPDSAISTVTAQRYIGLATGLIRLLKTISSQAT